MGFASGRFHYSLDCDPDYTLIRWWYLVRALGIDFSLRDALRIGFLGYLFNLAPMGIVGGDLLKAWMLAREKPGNRSDQPSNRAKALASVIVDRILESLRSLPGGIRGCVRHRIPGSIPSHWIPNGVVQWVCVAVWCITGVATVGVAIMLLPSLTGGPLTERVARIPRIGHAISGLFEAIKIYRTKRLVLLWSSIATVPVHGLLTVSTFLLALGLGFHYQLHLAAIISPFIR